MKEMPILFSAPMVRSILDGQKTMTRRIVKPQPTASIDWFKWPIPGKNVTKNTSYDWRSGSVPQGLMHYCPYGQIGDRLWVRETWAARPDQDLLPPYQCDDTGLWWRSSISTLSSGYEACHGKWRPSIFMPRWASRIDLEITNIKAERLQDITLADINAEGLDDYTVSNIISKVSSKLKVKDQYWFYQNEIDGESYCGECGHKRYEQLKKKFPKEGISFMGTNCEEDSQQFCGKCGVHLNNCYTECACESDLEHFEENGFSSNCPDDCFSLSKILDSCGWDLSKDLTPRIQRLCWQALFDTINGQGTWDKNPWVWVVEFKRVEDK